MKSAIILAGEKIPATENFSPKIDNDGEIKRELAQIIQLYPDKVVAEAVDTSPDTVKCWKAERSFPQGRHLMRLVQAFPKIRAWHDRRTGGINHPQSQVELFAELERIMASNTPEGRAMRARFLQIIAEEQGR